MLGIEDLERMVVDSVADEAKLGDSIDALLGHLLSGVPGYAWRPTDAVLVEHSRIDGRRVFVGSVVVMIDQTVEPMLATFTIGEDGSIASAQIHLGDRTTTNQYGSREHRKLREAILLKPGADRRWRESFHRDAGGWHYEARQHGHESIGATHGGTSAP